MEGVGIIDCVIPASCAGGVADQMALSDVVFQHEV